MMRVLVGLAAVAFVVAGCDQTSAPKVDEPPTAATTSAPETPDQSKVFFPGAVDTYGVNVSPTDRDHLIELHALRQIDPCGFVDQKTLTTNGHGDYSYTYTATRVIGEGSPIAPIGGDGCTIAFPSTKMALDMRVIPGEERANDSQFSPDAAHPGVTKRSSPMCTLRVELPLTKLAGAPATMRDPLVEVTPVHVSDGYGDFEDVSLCQLGEAVAVHVSAQVRGSGTPVYPSMGSAVAKFLTSDICAAAADLHAVGFAWKEPAPEAQWPVTWRRPGVCNLRPGEGGSSSAVVKQGLAVWADGVFFQAGDNPRLEDLPRTEQDGIELYDLSRENYCFVAAKGSTAVMPVAVGSGAPELVSPTPVIVVNMSAPEGMSCAEEAKSVALNAMKRAVG
ncbi:hypothetical protein ACFWE3_22055 [Mycobacteriaceae bacterium NPDC060252]